MTDSLQWGGGGGSLLALINNDSLSENVEHLPTRSRIAKRQFSAAKPRKVNIEPLKLSLGLWFECPTSHSYDSFVMARDLF